MSITVSDLLHLPSLCHASVIGGRGGLNKIVTSISVLEAVDTRVLVDGLFQKGEFFGSEIVITGFLNCLDDVECQCANIRRLAEGGEVGLILFYVGIYLPAVDKRLVALADELDFVLIQMPGLKNLRYGEVISDVTEYIFHDQEKNEFIVSDILARVSRLPEHLRTIRSVLRMLSSQVHASVVLTDDAWHILNLIAWPQNMGAALEGCQHTWGAYAGKGSQPFAPIPGSQVYHFTLWPDGGAAMHLFLIREGLGLNQRIQEQTADLVRISINIWGRGHGAVAIHELIRAILQDDPIKMRRLSDVFHIDVANIQEMWIIHAASPQRLDASKADVKRFCHVLEACTDTQFADRYDGQVLLFSSRPSSERAAEEALEEMLVIAGQDPLVSVCRCYGLENTMDVRQAYLCHQDYLPDARKIWPRKRIFSLGELMFARECHQQVEQGEEYLGRCSKYLDRLQSCSGEWDVAETLGVYLIDMDANVTRTAQAMFLHKNTVKYRLRAISDMLGFHPNKMPDNIQLYQSLAIRRLL